MQIWKDNHNHDNDMKFVLYVHVLAIVVNFNVVILYMC